MNFLVSEQIAREHLADLRREAAAHSRVASRADRARPHPGRRALDGLARFALQRRPCPAGCEA